MENKPKKIHALSFGKEAMVISSKEELNRQTQTISWGRKNDYPYKLLDLFYGSAIHQGIIRSKVAYINSKGFEILEGNEQEIESFLSNGISDYSINDVVDACVLDLEIFGGFAIKGAWNMEGTRPAWLEHVDFEALRPTDDEQVWKYSIDWTIGKQDEKTNYKEYKVLDLNNRKGEFIIVFKAPSKNKKGERGYFPKADYLGGLKAIETDVEISKFHLNEILNVFAGGTIINDPSGVPTTEEQIEGARRKKDVFTGADNAGQVIMNFSDGQEQAVTVLQLNGNDLDKRYLLTEKSVQDNILYSHSVTSPMLVGIKTPNQLGGSDELRNSFNIWNETYISRKQSFVDNAFNWLMNIVFNIEGVIKLHKANIDAIIGVEEVESELSIINNMNPDVSKALLRSLTVNELRALVGKEPIAGGDVIPETKRNNEFKKDKSISEVIGMFSKVGRPINECKVLLRGSIEAGATSEQGLMFAKESIQQEFDTIAGVKVESLQTSILKLLNDGANLTSIANEVNKPLTKVVEHAEQLRQKGLLTDNFQVSDRGRMFIRQADLELDQFEVRFTYEKRDDVDGAPVIPTTRDFCRDLIALGRAFTREEIDSVSAEIGRDVFKERGGWYHNPKTNQTTPFCRHIWKFNLVEK